ncbi:hypothetical protein ACUN24_16160 [Pedobacter sp. WC2501]|uniref:hypothetical protein n=1 Tax=Pedobacter sp. WC2501 TaxID=3461400 RepID=UPI004045B8AD
MKTIIPFSLIVMLSACTGSNTQTDKYSQQEVCICENTIETDSTVFATNVTIKKESDRTVLLFHCASIETGIASVSDKNGDNEQEKAIYDIRCISPATHNIELSGDFKYFTDAMKSQDNFFKILKDGKKHFFEFTLKKRKVESISKLDIESTDSQ